MTSFVMDYNNGLKWVKETESKRPYYILTCVKFNQMVK